MRFLAAASQLVEKQTGVAQDLDKLFTGRGMSEFLDRVFLGELSRSWRRLGIN